MHTQKEIEDLRKKVKAAEKGQDPDKSRDGKILTSLLKDAFSVKLQEFKADKERKAREKQDEHQDKYNVYKQYAKSSQVKTVLNDEFMNRYENKIFDPAMHELFKMQHGVLKDEDNQ